MNTAQQILYRIKHHVETVGTPLTKLGEVLGSKAKDRQAKITAAKFFLAGNPRAFSLERVEKLSKFYDRDFLSGASAMAAASSKSPYGHAAKIEKATDKQLDKLLVDVADVDPALLKGVPLSSLSTDAKRVILRAYYR